MKFSTIALLLCMAQHSFAQDAAIPTPEFEAKIMFVKKDNTLVNLDRTELARIQKDKLMPKIVKLATGYKFYYKAEGCCAKVSHSGKPTERFIIKIPPGIDPSEIIQLFKFQVKEDCRLLMYQNANLASALNDETAQMRPIALDFKTLHPGVYLISHEEQLEDGEYVFICGMEAGGTGISTTQLRSGRSEKGFCFSVQNNNN